MKPVERPVDPLVGRPAGRPEDAPVEPSPEVVVLSLPCKPPQPLQLPAAPSRRKAALLAGAAGQAPAIPEIARVAIWVGAALRCAGRAARVSLLLSGGEDGTVTHVL